MADVSFEIGLIILVLPLVQSMIQRPSWTSNQKMLLTIGLAVLSGIGLAWWSDELSRDGIVLNVGLIFAGMKISFETLYKATGVGSAVETTINGGSSGFSELDEQTDSWAELDDDPISQLRAYSASKLGGTPPTS